MDAENTIIVQCEHGIQVSQKNDNSHTREVNLSVITNCAVSSRATSLNVSRVEDMQSRTQVAKENSSWSTIQTIHIQKAPCTALNHGGQTTL